ncbi:MAG: M48 family metalloprotease [Reyranellaceae bacterium]
MIFFRRVIAVLALAALLLPTAALWQAAAAQSREKISLIRDAEIENAIRAYARPLFEAAGLENDAVSVHIVNDPAINAFVAGGQRLFLFTGLMMRAATAGQVRGVIAHETGHIAGGHLARLQEQLENATIENILEMLLTAAAIAGSTAAGAQTGTSRGGGPPVGVAQRGLFSYTRAQEQAADQAAVTLLDRIGQSSQGLADFTAMLMQQELVAGLRPDPYLRTHPLTQERVAFLRQHVETSRFSKVPVPAQLETMHERVVAKLYGFIDPAQALRKYPPSDNSVAGRYARSIAYYRSGNLPEAVGLIDGLIRQMPNDPYFHELRGQMLFENQRIAESIVSYERAVALLPQSGLLKIALAHALLQNPTPAQSQRAQKLLETVEQRERDSGYWRQMSMIYDQTGNIGMRALALAELAYARGDRVDALRHATAAEQNLKFGTPAYQRAQDIRFLAERPRRN